jgi:hypothetical protein
MAASDPAAHPTCGVFSCSHVTLKAEEREHCRGTEPEPRDGREATRRGLLSLFFALQLRLAATYGYTWLLHTVTPGGHIQLHLAVTYSYTWLSACYLQLHLAVAYTYTWLLHTPTPGCYIQLHLAVTYSYTWLLQTVTPGCYVQLHGTYTWLLQLAAT